MIFNLLLHFRWDGQNPNMIVPIVGGLWERHAAYRYNDLVIKHQANEIKPNWINVYTWMVWMEDWKMDPEFQALSQRNLGNRHSRLMLHTVESISHRQTIRGWYVNL